MNESQEKNDRSSDGEDSSGEAFRADVSDRDRDRDRDPEADAEEAGTREREAQSREREAKCRESEAQSRKSEAQSRKSEAQSRKSEAQSRESETQSRERESQQPGNREAGTQPGDSTQPGIESGGAKKPSSQILKHELIEACEALERSKHRLFLSGLSAGLDLGFSLLLIAIVQSSSEGVLAAPVLELILANMYAFGFVLVVFGRSELFTEQTTLAVLPVLDGQASLSALLRLWVVVYVSNLIGASVFAALTATIGPGMGTIDVTVLGRIAERMIDHSAAMIFLSALLAGWLMGLLSWLVAAGRDTISQLVIVWMVTAAIGLAGLHHSILGAIEVMASLFAGAGATFADLGHFLLWATLGNAFGGSVFVALLKYGPARKVRRRLEHLNPAGRTETAGWRRAVADQK